MDDATGKAANEWRTLRKWAEANGRLGGGLPRKDFCGAEHIVEIDKTRGRVIKATLPRSTKLTPMQYVNRILLHNQIFNDDIALERMVLLPDGMLSIVSSQPLIEGRDATVEEIDSMMRAKGFEKIGAALYYHGGDRFLVYDLFPRNAKVCRLRGIVRPFDSVILQAPPYFAAYLKSNPWILQEMTLGQNALRT